MAQIPDCPGCGKPLPIVTVREKRNSGMYTYPVIAPHVIHYRGQGHCSKQCVEWRKRRDAERNT